MFYSESKDKSSVLIIGTATDVKSRDFTGSDGKQHGIITFSVNIGKNTSNETIWQSVKVWRSDYSTAYRTALDIVKNDVVLVVGTMRDESYQNRNGETVDKKVLESNIVSIIQPCASKIRTANTSKSDANQTAKNAVEVTNLTPIDTELPF